MLLTLLLVPPDALAQGNAPPGGTFETKTPAAQEQRPEKRKAKPTLIVFNIVPEQGVGKGAANLLTEIVIDKAARLRTYEVIGQKDLEKMVFWEKTKMAAGCNETSCLVEIAGAMDASFYIEGSIGVMGDQFVVTLKLMDARDVRVIERATELVKRDDNAVVKAVAQMAKTVLGVSEPAVETSTLAGVTAVGSAGAVAAEVRAVNVGAAVAPDPRQARNPPVPEAPTRVVNPSVPTQPARPPALPAPAAARAKPPPTPTAAEPAPARAQGLAPVESAPAAPTSSRHGKPLNPNVPPATGQMPAATAPVTVAASGKKRDAGQYLEVKDRAEPDDQAATFRTLGKVGVFGGLGVATLGGLFTVLAKKSADDYRKGENPASMQNDLGKIDVFNALAISSYALGGAMAVGGSVLWGVISNKIENGGTVGAPQEQMMIMPQVAAQTFAVSAAGRW